MVHAPVGLSVNRDPHRMGSAAYPAVRFPAIGIEGLLNRAGAGNPALKKTGNSDGTDSISFDADGKSNLRTERGETVFRRHARGLR